MRHARLAEHNTCKRNEEAADGRDAQRLEDNMRRGARTKTCTAHAHMDMEECKGQRQQGSSAEWIFSPSSEGQRIDKMRGERLQTEKAAAGRRER